MDKKKFGWSILVVVAVLCVGYTAYNLGNKSLDKFRLKYQEQGRDITLQALTDAADQKQDVTVTNNGKTYKFVGIQQTVNPTGVTPPAIVPEPSPVPPQSSNIPDEELTK